MSVRNTIRHRVVATCITAAAALAVLTPTAASAGNPCQSE